jgi:hypothetical protein
MNIAVTVDPATRSLHIHLRAALDYPAGHVARLLPRIIEHKLRELHRIETGPGGPARAPAAADCEPHDPPAHRGRGALDHQVDESAVHRRVRGCSTAAPPHSKRRPVRP